MQEQLMVTSSGVKNGKAYATLNGIVQGVKENGDKYAFIDQNRKVKEQEEMPIGSIVVYETKRVVGQTVKLTPPPNSPKES
jgi:hypothetical protein